MQPHSDIGRGDPDGEGRAIAVAMLAGGHRRHPEDIVRAAAGILRPTLRVRGRAPRRPPTSRPGSRTHRASRPGSSTPKRRPRYRPRLLARGCSGGPDRLHQRAFPLSHLRDCTGGNQFPPGGVVKELPERRVQPSGGSVRALKGCDGTPSTMSRRWISWFGRFTRSIGSGFMGAYDGVCGGNGSEYVDSVGYWLVVRTSGDGTTMDPQSATGRWAG